MRLPPRSGPSNDPQGKSKSKRLEELKLDMESAARERAGKPPETPEAYQQTLYELRVHQIELEMQNEELRRAQLEIDIARARYFDLYDLAPVGYCTLDEAGLIVGANLTAVTMLGVPRTRLLERWFTRFVLKQDHPRFWSLMERGERHSDELRMRRDDGSLFWAHLAVTTTRSELGIVERRVVMSDVSDRKAEEAARLEGEARYRELFSRASDGIAIFTLEGVLVEANDTFARMHGLEGTSELRLKDLEVGEPSLTPGSVRRLILGETLRFEVEHRHQAGHTFPLEASLGPISMQGVPHALGFYRDISERRRVQAAFALNDRLANMGLLSAGIAHEINNPLAYVLANLEGVAHDLPAISARMTGAAPSEAAALDDVISRTRGALEGAQRIRTIARGLGSFSRVERGNIESVDVNRACASAVTLAHNELKYRARLVTHLSEIPRADASEGKLVQVVLNLLINAAQAIPEGFVDKHQITLRSWADGAEVFVEVVDTGRGIPKENLERIFEPFFTTKPHGVAGSGLGLSICKSLLSEFGGDIRAQSEPGRTSLLVTLRASKNDGPVVVPVVVTAAPSIRGRVLVVDDEVNICNVLRRNLRHEHDVVCAGSGAEALTILMKDHAFDVILCDLMMEGMTGMDLHEWIVTTVPQLASRVVFMSGGAFIPKAAAYLSGVKNELLAKPFDMPQLESCVRRRVAESRKS